MSIYYCQCCERPCDNDITPMQYPNICHYCCNDIQDTFDSNMNITINELGKMYMLDNETIKGVLLT